jgi:hypothetical protein
MVLSCFCVRGCWHGPESSSSSLPLQRQGRSLPRPRLLRQYPAIHSCSPGSVRPSRQMSSRLLHVMSRIQMSFTENPAAMPMPSKHPPAAVCESVSWIRDRGTRRRKEVTTSSAPRCLCVCISSCFGPFAEHAPTPTRPVCEGGRGWPG